LLMTDVGWQQAAGTPAFLPHGGKS
jgi:hypothetical protein